MHLRLRLMAVSLISVLACGAVYLACSQTNDNPDDEKNTQVEPLLVVRDDLFNFQVDDEIGRVEYEKVRGPVGSRIDALCIIERLTSFPDRKVNVRLELLNEDAARVGFEPQEWVQDVNRHSFVFYAPLVETVPVVLNFRVVVYYEEGGGDDTADDTADDDTVADDTVADDTSDDTAGDDTVLDKAGDDTEEDDTVVDDDADPLDFTAPFMAEARLIFIVNDGAPGAGD